MGILIPHKEERGQTPTAFRNIERWSATPLHPLDYRGGWNDFGAGFAIGAWSKDGFGYCHLHGQIISPSLTTGTASVIAVLPATCRPRLTRRLNAITTSGSVSFINVFSDGSLSYYAQVNGMVNLTLEGMSFVCR